MSAEAKIEIHRVLADVPRFVAVHSKTCPVFKFQ